MIIDVNKSSSTGFPLIDVILMENIDASNSIIINRDICSKTMYSAYTVFMKCL